jgi:hypothetical protein
VRESGRPGSSTFAITVSGKARLRELLAQPNQPAPPRNGLLLGRTLGPEGCRELLLQATTNKQRFVAVISRCHHLPWHNPSEAVVD